MGDIKRHCLLHKGDRAVEVDPPGRTIGMEARHLRLWPVVVRDFDRKLDAYRMLRDRWGVSWTFWRELCQEAREVGENEK